MVTGVPRFIDELPAGSGPASVPRLAGGLMKMAWDLCVICAQQSNSRIFARTI